MSLIVDQRIDPKKENLGVRPLPNLETKFVAANTLIGIDKPTQLLLRNPEIDRKEKELKEVRERHFTARTPQTKEKYRRADERLRAEISELLKKDGFPREMTEKLAKWNPYDQNASADFFDSEWMFGITEGFDVVIGNPPYKILTKNNTKIEELQLYLRQFYSIRSSYSKNIFTLFIELGIRTTDTNGILSFIVPEGLFQTRSYQPCVDELNKAGSVKTIVTFSNFVFENTITGNLIFLFLKNRNTLAL